MNKKDPEDKGARKLFVLYKPELQQLNELVKLTGSSQSAIVRMAINMFHCYESNRKIKLNQRRSGLDITA